MVTKQYGIIVNIIQPQLTLYRFLVSRRPIDANVIPQVLQKES